jgi:3,4-dihydroxy 2-butanone 4-phosphate synthase
MSRPASALSQALKDLAAGRPVLLYDADGREEETDIVFASAAVTPAAVATLRREAGGLICTTLGPQVHRALGLPYLSDIYAAASGEHPLLDSLLGGKVAYESSSNQKPSFGITINHRDTFTGVTDADRSLTITRLAALAKAASTTPPKALAADFARQFKAPGHVVLLNAHEKLLDGRAGHTELATALVVMAGLAPTATICEMMDGPQGRARPKQDAVKYAAQHGHAFLTGAEVLEAWRTFNRNPKRDVDPSA